MYIYFSILYNKINYMLLIVRNIDAEFGEAVASSLRNWIRYWAINDHAFKQHISFMDVFYPEHINEYDDTMLHELSKDKNKIYTVFFDEGVERDISEFNADPHIFSYTYAEVNPLTDRPYYINEINTEVATTTVHRDVKKLFLNWIETINGTRRYANMRE